jgi:hypothetical protein
MTVSMQSLLRALALVVRAGIGAGGVRRSAPAMPSLRNRRRTFAALGRRRMARCARRDTTCADSRAIPRRCLPPGLPVIARMETAAPRRDLRQPRSRRREAAADPPAGPRHAGEDRRCARTGEIRRRLLRRDLAGSRAPAGLRHARHRQGRCERAARVARQRRRQRRGRCGACGASERCRDALRRRADRGRDQRRTTTRRMPASPGAARATTGCWRSTCTRSRTERRHAARTTDAASVACRGLDCAWLALQHGAPRGTPRQESP